MAPEKYWLAFHGPRILLLKSFMTWQCYWFEFHGILMFQRCMLPQISTRLLSSPLKLSPLRKALPYLPFSNCLSSTCSGFIFLHDGNHHLTTYQLNYLLLPVIECKDLYLSCSLQYPQGLEQCLTHSRCSINMSWIFINEWTTEWTCNYYIKVPYNHF